MDRPAQQPAEEKQHGRREQEDSHHIGRLANEEKEGWQVGAERVDQEHGETKGDGNEQDHKDGPAQAVQPPEQHGEDGPNGGTKEDDAQVEDGRKQMLGEGMSEGLFYVL